MKKHVTSFIAFFTILFFSTLFAAPQIDLQQLMLEAEQDASVQLQAKKLAKQQGLPSNIMLANGTFMYPLGTENGEVIYAVIRNLAHPLQDGSTAFWNEIEQSMDLANADIYYAGDRLRHQATASSKRATTLVLVPESTNDGVMAFDYATGDLVDPNFIPPSPGPLSTPLMARESPTGTVTVSDQIEDLVLQFDTTGVLIDTLAPAGGPAPDTLNNVRGHNYLPNGNLIATVALGANSNSIAEFDPAGNYLGNFIDIGVGGLDSPWDIQFRANDILITSIDTDNVLRYDLSGAFLDVFGQTTNFPQQISEDADGNVLVGVFSLPETGVVVYDANGTLLRTLTGIDGNRAAFRLGNGNVLTTNGAGVFELDFNTGAVIRNTVAGVNARLAATYGEGGSSSDETAPPRDLAATVNGFTVDLSWRAPLPEGASEIAYDDGSGEGNISIGANAEGEAAARFTPNVYPTTLLQVVVQFANSAAGAATTDLTIYDGNGTTGPGTTLLTQSYDITNRGAFDIIDVSGAAIDITADDFFFSFSEIVGETMNLEWDTNSPTAGRAWINAPGIGFPWQPFGNINATFDNNLLVRAVVREGTGPNSRIAVIEADGQRHPLTITEYKELLAGNAHVASRAGAVHVDGSPVAKTAALPAAPVASSKAGASSGETLAALSGYNVYRSDDGGSSYAIVASPDSASTSYNDAGAPRNVELFYYMTAVYTGGEGNPSDTVSVTVVSVFEDLAEHNTPEFRSGVTNEGTLGMLNAFGGTPGFEWPLGTNQLFEGGVMVGIAPDQVSDAARLITGGAQNSLDEDFAFTSNVDTVSSTTDETIYVASYDDSNHPNGPQADDGPNAAMPIEVVQTSYSYSDADNSGYLIMKIQVVNTGSTTLDGVRVGQYHDWDINTYASNTGEVVFDITSVAGENNDLPFEMEFVRLFDAASPVPYIGAVPLSQNAFLASWILDNATEVFPGGASPLSEANKYNYMGARRTTDPFGDPAGPADKSLLFGLGGGVDNGPPASGYTIAPGDTITTGVAIVGGNDAADFLANGKAALQKWSDLGNDIAVLNPLFTGLGDDGLSAIPTEFSLDQNYPNPFNPTTSIKYGLKETADVNLTVYNMLGQKVRTLVREQQTAGFQTVQWDGRNDNGVKVASGIYVYKLSANDFVSSKKLILMK